MTPQTARAIAEQFVAARREGRALHYYPGDMPETLDDAYRIQAEAVALVGEPVRGWKVALIKPELRARFGAERIAGPVFHIWDGTAENPVLPLFTGGYAAAEAEIQLRIGHVPFGVAPSLEDAVEAIDKISIGIEAAGSPFPGINTLGPAVTVSDFGNNNGLVVGREASQRLACLADCNVISKVNGEVVGSGAVGNPFEAARFLFEMAAMHGLNVQAGQWISSGAITGAHPVHRGDHYQAEFGGIGIVACTFDAG